MNIEFWRTTVNQLHLLLPFSSSFSSFPSSLFLDLISHLLTLNEFPEIGKLAYLKKCLSGKPVSSTNIHGNFVSKLIYSIKY
jgi:hypothetical protein